MPRKIKPRGNRNGKGARTTAGRFTSEAQLKYDPSYCQRLVAHMAKGLSITAFAASIGVSRQTLVRWRSDHPEFAEAHERGIDAYQLFWEREFRRAFLGEIKNCNITAGIWLTKNILGWRDKVEYSGNVERPISVQTLQQAFAVAVGDSKIIEAIEKASNVKSSVN